MRTYVLFKPWPRIVCVVRAETKRQAVARLRKSMRAQRENVLMSWNDVYEAADIDEDARDLLPELTARLAAEDSPLP